MISPARLRPAIVRRLDARRLAGRDLSSKATAQCTDAVLLDGHTLNLRGPLPEKFAVDAPTVLRLAARGAKAELPAIARRFDGRPEWIVATDLTGLLAVGRGPWVASLVQPTGSLPVLLADQPSSANAGIVDATPPSLVDGTRFSFVAGGHGRLVLYADAARPGARVARIQHGPGVLHVELDVVGLDPSRVREAVLQSRIDEKGTVLAVTLEEDRIVVAVPTARIADVQDVGDPVRWRLSLRTDEGRTVRAGRIGSDVESVDDAQRFPPVVIVGEDGTRTRSRPVFTAKQGFDLRITRLEPASGYAASRLAGDA